VATPYRIRAVEREHATPIDTLIPDLVNALGSQKAAAARLGLSQATISTWLKEHGYIARIIYTKGEEQHGNGSEELNDQTVHAQENANGHD
jgi:predicted transcriptional regulator